ncbi:TrmH family RNA methyltransferase [Muriicola sp. Z0-33]|uniref:TrmH family RNA methyltransferase n=1 Tax=Muriicola sp. Z0-33 TaxID=2816957 RepID=UPI002238777F|nr:RNA methyltransferase [Muriicola sp. Z0-33]MCW5517093.1 RNA methyltransferase [Muriicola sp. Z0-33]
MVDVQLLDYLEGFISEERKERFLNVLKMRTKYITVAAEDVFQMHNTSALIRSCEVFGIQEAHVIEGRFGNRLDKNIAMGAQQWVDVYRYKDTTDCLTALRQEGYKIIATTPHEDSCMLQDFKLEGKTALFFGTEKEGLSSSVLNAADGYLKIPMVGFTESLNVSVSVAIILQQLSRQLRASDLPWPLLEPEILEKRLDWTRKSIKSIDKIMDRYKKEL